MELDGVADDRVRTFSVGMKRRLSLARVLLGRARVFLLDEPFTGLDQRGRKWLTEFLLAFKAGGGAVVVATHSLTSGLGAADRLAILAGGRLMVDRPCDGLGAGGDPADLRGRDRRRRGTRVSAYARRAGIVLWKDLLTERRSKESLNALLFFSLLLLFLFEFALGPERERVRAALPGLLWLGILLASLLGLGRSFMIERDNDCWEGLRLVPGDKSAVYVGKLAGNALMMTAVEVVLLACFGLFYDVPVAAAAGPLAAVLVLGTVGLAAVGTLFAAMTSQVRARELLFPVLLLPALVPLLLATVSSTQAVLTGQPLAEVSHWLKLLAAADVVYVVIGLLTFEFILDA